MRGGSYQRQKIKKSREESQVILLQKATMFIACSENLAEQDRVLWFMCRSIRWLLGWKMNMYLTKHAQVAEEAGSMSSYRLKRQTCSHAHAHAGPTEERSSALTQGKSPCLYLPGPREFPIHFSSLWDQTLAGSHSGSSASTSAKRYLASLINSPSFGLMPIIFAVCTVQ